ncbi:MarR family transcriptional regulator [Geminicoccaceae bacterium 1502E]|nr:MarR family transcriptional regulator [Geminicoccaceae bacterium 1502E]
MAPRNPLFLRDEELERSLELLLLAERDLLARAGEALAREQLSEQDFRLLYLVQRHPGSTIAELCTVLGMTKQSLSRHIQALVATGLLRQQAASRGDRRRRPLVVTEAAVEVIARVGEAHKAGLRRAFKNAGPEAVEGFQRVLAVLIDGPGRRLLGKHAA